MNSQRLLQRITLCLLNLLLLLTLCLPAGAHAENPAAAIRPGDVLCFGEPDEASGFDGKWLVLDSEKTSMGTPGLFLVSLNLIGDEAGQPLLFRDIGDVTVSFGDRGEAYAAAHPGVTDYQGSDLQRWSEAFYESRFTEAEQQAILPTYKSDAGTVLMGFGIPLPGAAGGTVDFDPAENILAGDRLFPLSAEEATGSRYGLGDSASRVALYKGKAAGWWLRSPHIPTFPLDVGFVFSFGAVMDYPVNAKSMFGMETYARPACNLDGGAITRLEPLLTEGERTVWRVSFAGEVNGRTYDPALPDVGHVVNPLDYIGVVLAAVAILVLLLLFLLVRFIVKRVRKRTRKENEAPA